MNFRLLLSLFVLLPSFLLAQFTDDFSDGDFTTNPTWSGDDSEFEIDASNRLHLDAPSEASPSHLSTPSESIIDASWEFNVELDFNPTSSNMAQVYLVSNNTDLEGELQGYFVRIGNTTKEVSLYRQDGLGDIEEIIDGTDNDVDMDVVNVRVKVTRSETGLWELLIDNAGGEDYATIGTATDDTYTSSQFFGVHCKYTATRSDKFYFSNFIVSGSGFVDTEAPTLISYEVINQNQVSLLFSEPMNEATISNSSNYFADGGLGNPSNADVISSTLVDLNFTTDFVDSQIYNLTINNVSDPSGNMLSTDIEFSYLEISVASTGDVVINELMADPSPVVGLPDVEFVEIYNATDNAFDLEGWALINTTSVNDLTGVLAGNSYLILCDEDDVSQLSIFGNILGISSFSTLANSGDSLTLISSTSEIIDVVNYDVSWYQNSDLSDGGYSLERKNPFDNCTGEDNWSGSLSLEGGSPGEVNANYDLSPDETIPVVLNVYVGTENVVNLTFSESIDPTDLEVLSNFVINNGIGNPEVINVINDQTIDLVFTESFLNEESYQLNLNNLHDLCGNLLLDVVDFTYYTLSEALAGDVIFNEIMSDPLPSIGLPEVEYIEILNTSENNFDLSNWILINSTSNNNLGGVLPAGEFLILCDAANVEALSVFGDTWGVNSFSALAFSADSLTLVDSSFEVIDIVSYTDDWYQETAQAGDGHSLERINPFLQCSGEGNWRASSAVLGGTPGSENAVYDTSPDLISPSITDIYVNSESEIIVIIDEILMANDVDEAEFLFSNDISVTSVMLTGDHQVTITVNPAIVVDVVYTLTINDLQDCAGNIMIANNQIEFGLPEPILENDIVINEILFNPRPDGFDFIEIYNNSDKLLSLKNCKFAGLDEEIFVDFETITANNKILFPEEYLVLTMDKDNILEEYPNAIEEKIFEMEYVPSLNDNEGVVILLSAANESIDNVYYNDDFHFELLDDVEGVSLERLNFDEPSNDPNNWSSAAESEGFATPGYINSQQITFNEQITNFTIQPRVISPDNDGFEDIMAIRYSLDQPGFIANISILDDHGRLINKISQNELLAVEGTLYWDGLMEEGTKAPIGIYIVYIEFFDLEGNVETAKEVVTVAARL